MTKIYANARFAQMAFNMKADKTGLEIVPVEGGFEIRQTALVRDKAAKLPRQRSTINDIPHPETGGKRISICAFIWQGLHDGIVPNTRKDAIAAFAPRGVDPGTIGQQRYMYNNPDKFPKHPAGFDYRGKPRGE